MLNFCSTTHLQSIVHRRLQSGRMNTRLGADRWSSLLSVSTPLQMVNFVLLWPFYIFPSSLPPPPFFFFFFSVFCTNSFYCSTLRPQCNSLPPRLNAFPVVNPFLMYILCRCFSPTINFQLFPTNVSVGSQFISIIAVWDSVVGILIWCMH